jgi:hypothetical protein
MPTPQFGVRQLAATFSQAGAARSNERTSLPIRRRCEWHLIPNGTITFLTRFLTIPPCIFNNGMPLFGTIILQVCGIQGGAAGKLFRRIGAGCLLILSCAMHNAGLKSGATKCRRPGSFISLQEKSILKGGENALEPSFYSHIA